MVQWVQLLALSSKLQISLHCQIWSWFISPNILDHLSLMGRVELFQSVLYLQDGGTEIVHIHGSSSHYFWHMVWPSIRVKEWLLITWYLILVIDHFILILVYNFFTKVIKNSAMASPTLVSQEFGTWQALHSDHSQTWKGRIICHNYYCQTIVIV